MRILEEDASEEEQSETSTIEPDSDVESIDFVSLLSEDGLARCDDGDEGQGEGQEVDIQLWFRERCCRTNHAVANPGREGRSGIANQLQTWEVADQERRAQILQGQASHSVVDVRQNNLIVRSEQDEFEPLVFPDGASLCSRLHDVDVDTVSWMIVVPTTLQLDHPNPYPWQASEHEEFLDEDVVEPAETAFAADRAKAKDFIVLAEEELSNSIQPWTAVTYGAEVLDRLLQSDATIKSKLIRPDSLKDVLVEMDGTTDGKLFIDMKDMLDQEDRETFILTRLQPHGLPQKLLLHDT